MKTFLFFYIPVLLYWIICALFFKYKLDELKDKYKEHKENIKEKDKEHKEIIKEKDKEIARLKEENNHYYVERVINSSLENLRGG